MRNSVTMMKDRFKSKETGMEVEGITIMIDGILKDVMDIIIDNSDTYQSYEMLIGESVRKGLDEIRREIAKEDKIRHDADKR